MFLLLTIRRVTSIFTTYYCRYGRRAAEVLALSNNGKGVHLYVWRHDGTTPSVCISYVSYVAFVLTARASTEIRLAFKSSLKSLENSWSVKYIVMYFSHYNFTVNRSSLYCKGEFEKLPLPMLCICNLLSVYSSLMQYTAFKICNA
jgi:hypothetical protein